MNVLLVEDYPLSAALVCHALARSAPHIRFDVASTVAMALEKFESQHSFHVSPLLLADRPSQYDCVLTDLNLPDGSGFEILMHIRASPFAIPVIILTGSSDAEVVRYALAAGAMKCIMKDDNYLARLPDILNAAVVRRVGSSPWE